MAVNSLNDRVIKLVEEKAGGVPSRFAKSIGHKRPDKIYNIVKKDTGVSQAIIDDILKTYKDVSIDWLMNGKGKMYKEEYQKTDLNHKGQKLSGETVVHTSNTNFASPSQRDNLIIVPIKAFGGFLMGYDDKVFLDGLQRMPEPLIQGECYRFEVDGFSMYYYEIIKGRILEEGYKPGSWVLATEVEAQDHMLKGKDYVLVTTDGVLIKRFEKLEEKKALFTCINDEYPGVVLDRKGIKKIYLVQKKIS